MRNRHTTIVFALPLLGMLTFAANLSAQAVSDPFGSNPFGSPTQAQDPFASRVQKDDSHAALRATARNADQRVKLAAAKIHREGASMRNDPKVRTQFRQLVVKAFQARQELHQAELKEMQQRVEKLTQLLKKRRGADTEIVDRRVSELLDLELRWEPETDQPKDTTPAAEKSVEPVAAMRTTHFWVESDPFGSSVEPNLLATIAKDAESQYRELTEIWFKHDPIPLAVPCGIDVTMANHTGRSSLSYSFLPDGKVDGAMMHLEGGAERLPALLRHEVMHLVLAAEFKTALPRWLDEGISFLQESSNLPQRYKQRVAAARTFATLIPLRELLAMENYPADTLLMYAQSSLLVDWLLQQGGKGKLVECLRSVDAREMAKALPGKLVAAYEFESFEEMETAWLKSLPETDVPSPRG